MPSGAVFCQIHHGRNRTLPIGYRWIQGFALVVSQLGLFDLLCPAGDYFGRSGDLLQILFRRAGMSLRIQRPFVIRARSLALPNEVCKPTQSQQQG